MEKIIIVMVVVVLLAVHLITDELDRRREKAEAEQEMLDISDEVLAAEGDHGKTEVGIYAESSSK